MQFGCNVSKYDSRDYTLKSDVVSKSDLPEEFILPVEDLRIKNQMNVSSCVAHATSSILEYHSNPRQKLSTNFIYGIQKALFNRETEGMCLRDACKIAAVIEGILPDACHTFRNGDFLQTGQTRAAIVRCGSGSIDTFAKGPVIQSIHVGRQEDGLNADTAKEHTAGNRRQLITGRHIHILQRCAFAECCAANKCILYAIFRPGGGRSAEGL